MDTHPDTLLPARQAFSEMSLELRKRVLKLRWIGEETEAERLTVLLHKRWPTLPIIVAPETD